MSDDGNWQAEWTLSSDYLFVDFTVRAVTDGWLGIGFSMDQPMVSTKNLYVYIFMHVYIYIYIYIYDFVCKVSRSAQTGYRRHLVVKHTPLLSAYSLLKVFTLHTFNPSVLSADVVLLARLSHGAERESGLLPYTDPCLTPQEFLGVL